MKRVNSAIHANLPHDGGDCALLARIAREFNDEITFKSSYEQAREQDPTNSKFMRLALESSPLPPILIYQMEKVGSTALIKSFEKLEIPNLVYREHYLSWRRIAGEHFNNYLVPQEVPTKKAITDVNRQILGDNSDGRLSPWFESRLLGLSLLFFKI